MLQHTKSPSGDESWTSATGEVHLRTLGPNMFHWRFVGQMGDEFIDVVNREIGEPAKGTVVIFTDTTKMTGYSPTFRAASTETAKKRRGKRESHTLVTSKLAAMGAAVYNLATGNNMTVYDSPAAFEAAMAARIKR